MQLFTSINPNMKRTAGGKDVSQGYQHECISTWQAAGFAVTTLNNGKEAAQIADAFPEVRIIGVPSNRPTICDFLHVASEETAGVAGIVNSDCMFLGNADVARRIVDVSKAGMLIMERINLDAEALTPAKPCLGFDAFFFSTNILDRLRFDETLQIGDTWWDYIFPISYMSAGGRLYQSASMILHLNHPVVWSDSNYVRGGSLAASLFAGKHGLPLVDDNELETLGGFAGKVFKLLRASAERVNLRGNGLTEQMADHLALGLQELLEPKPYVQPLDIEEIGRKAVEAYRLGRPPSRTIGEICCSVAVILRKIFPPSRTADALFSAGNDLLFPLYAGEAPKLQPVKPSVVWKYLEDPAEGK